MKNLTFEDLTTEEKIIFINTTLSHQYIDGNIESLFNDKQFTDIIEKVKSECNEKDLVFLNDTINFYKNK